ncbi:SigE family RNA polymerase sigma factor [Dactylosporangium vinaceum]|uniref:SigE family RNA polymerase sigma factor n=1 Tax=Dactylosporangium vinaceum TaxID=53362 RepID=A0ABV5M8V6_9ACTN|nr:SigE family RNA polymerase sigma factor [Dactylosporangium vinaceum]UAB99548.1 SigE family RNA polymerase sigma factor [Dactylosporangium vinaceum]
MRAEQDYVAYVEARLPSLRRVARLVVGDGHRADDAVQDALSVLYRRWGRLTDVANLDAYVHTMVVRACLSYRRHRWARVLLRDDPPDTPVESGSRQVDEWLTLRAALHRLPEAQRMVVILRYLCDMPVAEVAKVLKCSEGTVKSRTHHGLQGLRSALLEDAPARATVITHRRGQA